ncbi:UDP-glucuronosyltransferase 2A2-like isoform X1 [Ammospiza nelsoni]|uniref:UDP-glucuronosyltransferase 2A2-like isoform X1 n=1 Tax=Ammospiza caudacuta TaxID=2857398 RepID=UPI002739EBD3|nr:UDP-glucuronosyltransferase 2A2-like isoform X1 [Ammospiza caudacuta]XP_059327272.1 UDP-glucuronosyltransferase 2A2-like isoform X1 [Ammospiza nelsoni]
MAMKTTGSKKYLQLLLFQFALLGPVFCGKVLVWPTEGSHWLNMNVMVQELIRRGHSFTILVANASLFIEPRPKTTEKFEIYNVPYEKDLPEALINGIVDLWLNHRPTILTFWRFYKELGRLSIGWQEMNKMMCDAVLNNQELMARLQGSGFDLLLSDAVTPCGELLALKLGIPFVYSLRFSPAFTLERHCGKIPAPPSYTPAALSELTDRMSFGERVKNFVSYHLQDYVFQSYWGHWDTYYSKVLADNSHWLNMENILQELVARGHEVTVLLPSCFLIVNPTKPSPFQFEVIEVPITKKEMTDLMDKMFYFFFYEEKELPIWKGTYKIVQMMLQMKNINKIICDGVVKNEALMERLRASAFDLLLADPLFPSGELVAEKLGIPFVYTFRFSMGNTVERLCGTLPAPPSYVPTTLTSLTDRMTFWQRLKNTLGYALQDFMFHYVLWANWDQYYSEVLGRPTTLCETMGKAEIWLIRTYWDFEFPRPFLPNFEFVGGLHCQPAKPLPKEMEEFVQSSGEHGVIVFTLGSMVHSLSDEKSNVIAKALSQLPQKVLWRYKGKKPETLGSNTRIFDWIPQNDLLGHPLTKAFITHGGTNGLYEAIYHGIPMVGIPMFADQHDNLAHMVAKGAAVQVDFNTMKTQDLVDALKTVIYNSTYKENALKLSKIQHDQPVKPLDRAVFWIEFVMRHKGAKHLRPAAHHLTWYQYHSLDVLAFLFTCIATIVFILFKCCLCCCRRCGRIAKRKTE